MRQRYPLMAETSVAAPAKTDVLLKPKTEPLLGKKERALLVDPLMDNNPILIQILGICSALAVTTMVVPSLVMGVAVMLVTAFSNLAISVIRDYIPKSIRLIVQLVVVAFLVTIVELVLKAAAFPVYKQLSVFVGLIITNCIVMGRLEAYAMANKPWRSFLDGIGNGLGYTAILLIVAVIREIFGKGTLFAGSGLALRIIGPGEEFFINTAAEGSWMGWYANNNLMVLPAAAMFIISILIWVQRSYNPKLVDIS